MSLYISGGKWTFQMVLWGQVLFRNIQRGNRMNFLANPIGIHMEKSKSGSLPHIIHKNQFQVEKRPKYERQNYKDEDDRNISMTQE